MEGGWGSRLYMWQGGQSTLLHVCRGKGGGCSLCMQQRTKSDCLHCRWATCTAAHVAEESWAVFAVGRRKGDWLLGSWEGEARLVHAVHAAGAAYAAEKSLVGTGGGIKYYLGGLSLCMFVCADPPTQVSLWWGRDMPE